MEGPRLSSIKRGSSSTLSASEGAASPSVSECGSGSTAEERAAARAAKKQAEKEARLAKKKGVSGDDAAGGGGEDDGTPRKEASQRMATGVLQSEKRARDVKIGGFSLSLYGRVLVEDTTIELNWGQRYGLLGRNGCGKSALLKTLAEREVPLPDHIDTYLLEVEAEITDLSALQYVVESAQKEFARLEALAEKLLIAEGPDSEALMEVNDRQAELDPATMETRASTILVGLGFNSQTVHKLTKVGGWGGMGGGGWGLVPPAPPRGDGVPRVLSTPPPDASPCPLTEHVWWVAHARCACARALHLAVAAAAG